MWLLHPDGTFVDLYRGDPSDSRDDTQLQDKGRLLSWSIRLRLRR